MDHVRALAYYLPQYHPIPENDKWWGKGFTEWTNVAKAKPLFEGHKQPHLPADLGYYDLRVPEVREQQALLAKKAGIEGFCYWHYWFGNGKRLLEKPFKEVLESGKPSFPFCLAWANETWTGIWYGASENILMKQEYPGKVDYENHFYDLLPAFQDKRYIKIDGHPIFIVYNPAGLPDMNEFCTIFKELAIKNGLKGLHLIANSYHANPITINPKDFGFDAYTICGHDRILHDPITYSSKQSAKPLLKRLQNYSRKKILDCFDIKISHPIDRPAKVFSYREAMKYFLYKNEYNIDLYPTVVTGWDNSPRSAKNGLILTGYNPEIFRIHVREALMQTEHNENKIVFIKSWNEWAEGNYLEPEIEFGNAFSNVLNEEISFYNTNCKSL